MARTNNERWAGYEAQKRLTETFLSGEFPSWMVDNAQNGGSVFVDSDSGGRLVLSTGTQSNGIGELQTKNFTLGDYDAVSFRVLYGLGDASEATAVVDPIKFEDPTGSGNLVFHRLVSASNSTDTNALEARRDGASTRVTTRDGSETSGVEGVEDEIFFDGSAGRVIHRFQGTHAASITSGTPDPSALLQGRAFIQTEDTAADRRLYLNLFEVSFYNRL